MSYLTDYNAQRRHLSRLTRALGLRVSCHNGKRRIPLSNADLRVAIHDHCLGRNWGDLIQGANAAAFDQGLGRMVDTLEMRNGFDLAVSQALIRAGKHEASMARSETAITRDSKGRMVVKPMTHAHRMARMQAASEFYAMARQYQSKHEEATRAAEQRQ